MPSSEETLIFSLLLDKWLPSWRSRPLKECKEKSEELPSPLIGTECKNGLVKRRFPAETPNYDCDYRS